jgi:hypothetical protein
MNESWLRRKVDDPEVLARYSDPVRCRRRESIRLAEELRKGGELWEFSSDPESWRLMGRDGLCVVRDGKVVASDALLYKVDGRRRPFAEHWRIQWPRLDRFLVAALCKLLGIQRRCTFGIRRPEGLNLHRAPEVPEAVRGRLANAVRACEGLGLAFQFYASVDATVGTRFKAYTAALLHADGLFWATAIALLLRGRRIERTRPATFTCFSRLPDGRYVVTSDHYWKLTPHPGDLTEHLDGAPPAAVVDRHRRRIHDPALRPVAVREEELAGVILGREQRHVDYQIERGVYVPMTGEEIEYVTGKWCGPGQPPDEE